MVARWLPGTMESDDNSPQGATLRKVFEHGVISFFFSFFFFFLFVCTYDLFTGRWIPLAKLIAFICQCAYSSIKETTVTYAWARYSQWYSLGKGYSRRSLHFLALIWMFGTRHNENSIVRESKQRKGSLDNFSFRMVFIFFPPKHKFRESWFIFQTNDQLCRTRVCALSIHRTRFLLSICTYISSIYVYIVATKHTRMSKSVQETIRNKIRNMQWLIIIPLNKITIRTYQLAGLRTSACELSNHSWRCERAAIRHSLSTKVSLRAASFPCFIRILLQIF